MNSAKCRQCGFVGWADAEVCKRCGASMFSDVPETAQPQGGNLAAPPSYYAVQSHTELKNGLAITALVSGILNFLLLSIFVIPLVAGIVISVVALKRIKRAPYEYGGKSLAVSGLVLNIVSAVSVIGVMLIAAIAIPNLLASRRAANEGVAIRSLRIVHGAEQTYQGTRGRGQYGSLDELQMNNLISAELAREIRSGYQYKLEVFKASSESPAAFAFTAIPTDYGATGKRSFFVDETGVIRGEDRQGLEANRNTPPVGAGRDPREARSERVGSRSNYEDE